MRLFERATGVRFCKNYSVADEKSCYSISQSVTCSMESSSVSRRDTESLGTLPLLVSVPAPPGNASLQLYITRPPPAS